MKVVYSEVNPVMETVTETVTESVPVMVTREVTGAVADAVDLIVRTPTRVIDTNNKPLEEVRQLTAGGNFSAAIVGDTLYDTLKEGNPEFDATLVYAWGDNSHGQLGVAIGAGSGNMQLPADTTRATLVRKGGTVSMVENVGSEIKGGEGKRTSEYIRENLYIGAGDNTLFFIQEDGTVWFSGENGHHEGSDFTTTDRYVPTQTGLDTFYALYIGEARIFNRTDLTNSVPPSPWDPKMPRSVSIYDNQWLYIVEKDLRQAFSSSFNVLDPDFERLLPDDAIISYSSSDPYIANFELDENGRTYLKPTGKAYGRIIITLRNARDMYWGDYEVYVLPTEINAVVPNAVASVVAGTNVTVALQADGTVWQWGKFSINGYTVTYEYPRQVVFDGMAANEHIVQIEGYDASFMALSNLGNVYTWGNNDYGQLGNGTSNYNFNSSNGRYERNAWNDRMGDANSKAVKVTALGLNGTSNTGPIFNISMGKNIAMAVSAGKEVGGELVNVNAVWIWGINDHGQQGTGSTYSIWNDSATTYYWKWYDGHDDNVNSLGIVRDRYTYRTPHKVVGQEGIDDLVNITRVAAGNGHALALRSDSTVYAWGWNAYGQLGDNTTTDRYTPIRVTPGEYDSEAYYLRDVIRIDAATQYSMAMMRNGEIYMWGLNHEGVLGVDPATKANSLVPMKVTLVSPFTNVEVRAAEINAGIHHAMATSQANVDLVFAWGLNRNHQLGLGVDDTNVYTPTAILAGDNRTVNVNNTPDAYFRTTSGFGAGNSHTVLMDWQGQVYIMGHYDWGKFDQDAGDSVVNQDSKLPDRFGNEELKLYRWIKNDQKQSNFYTLQVRVLPEQYTMDRVVKDKMAAGMTEADARAELDKLIPAPAEGRTMLTIPFSELYEDYDYTYSLRFGATRTKLTSNPDAHPEYITAISSDPSVVTARVTDTGVVIESTGIGQANVSIRNTMTGYSFTITVRVTEVSLGVPNAVATPMVSSGNSFTIALKANGTVWAWGSWGRHYSSGWVNYSVDSPRQITGFTGNAIAVTAGYDHALILSDDGSVWGVGYNTDGELGRGGNNYDGYYNGSSYEYTGATTTALKVTGFADNVKIGQIAAGRYFSAAVDKITGEVYVWGRNYFTENRTMTRTDSYYNTVNQLLPRLTAPTKLRAGFSASHTETISGSVGYQHNEFLTNIIMVSATNFALYLLRQDGTVFVVGTQDQESILDNGGVLASNQLMGAGYGKTLYSVKEYNPYAVAGGNLGATYLDNVLTLTSGDYHTAAVRGITTSSDITTYTYTCPRCAETHTGEDGWENHTVTREEDGTVTLTCTLTTTVTEPGDGSDASGDEGDETADTTITTTETYILEADGEYIETTHTIVGNHRRDVVAWGNDAYTQLGDQQTTNRGLADYVTGLGTANDADGRDVDFLKLYAGANNLGTIYTEDLSKIDPDTHKLNILGKNDYYQQGDNDKTTPASTGDRALEGNSYNTRTVHQDADFGAYFNRIYDLTLGSMVTVAVQKEGSVWAWGSDADNRRGDFNGVNGEVGTPVQVGLEDYYDLLINKAELYAYQITGVSNGNDSLDAGERNYTQYTREKIVDYSRSATFAPVANQNPLSRNITLRPYQDLEVDLKSMFVRQDWGFNLRLDGYEDVAAMWECMKVRSLNTDLVTVIPFAFEYADGTAVADESKVTGDYESFVDENNVPCYPTKVRLSVDRDQSAQGHASIIFQDMEREVQSLLLISVIPALEDDTTDQSANLADIDTNMSNAKAIAVPQVVMTGASDTGYNTAYALTAYGELYAWGHNNYGQAAYAQNTTTPKTVLNTTSLDVPHLAATDVVQVSATNGSVVIVKKDGTVWQAGNRATTRWNVNAGFTQVSLSNVIKVGIGTAVSGALDNSVVVERSCNSGSSVLNNDTITYHYALNKSGQVYIWYTGSFWCPGWLYHGSHNYEQSFGPSLVSDQFGNALRYIVDIAVGEAGILALGADGSLYYGRIGAGSLQRRTSGYHRYIRDVVGVNVGTDRTYLTWNNAMSTQESTLAASVAGNSDNYLLTVPGYTMGFDGTKKVYTMEKDGETLYFYLTGINSAMKNFVVTGSLRNADGTVKEKNVAFVWGANTEGQLGLAEAANVGLSRTRNAWNAMITDSTGKPVSDSDALLRNIVAADFSAQAGIFLTADGRIYTTGNNQDGARGTQENFSTTLEDKSQPTRAGENDSDRLVMVGGEDANAVGEDNYFIVLGESEQISFDQIMRIHTQGLNLYQLTERTPVANPEGVATTTTMGTTNVVLMGDTTEGSGSVKAWKDLPKASDSRFVYASSDTRIATVSVNDTTGEVIITANSKGYYGDTIISLYDTVTGMEGRLVVTVRQRLRDEAAGWVTQVAAPKIVAARNFSVALKADGTVWTWGSAGGSYPVQVQRDTGLALTNIVDIAADATNGGIALDATGTVYRWAPSVFKADQTYASDKFGGEKVVKIAAGDNLRLALTESGKVWAWGTNGNGQLGNGTSDNSDTNPVRVRGVLGGSNERYQLDGVVAIAAGMYTAAALRADGTLVIWGNNANGQVGYGIGQITLAGQNYNNKDVPMPVRAGATSAMTYDAYLRGAVGVSLSNESTMALMRDRQVYTWGDNYYGQLGIAAGDVTDRALPALAGQSWWKDATDSDEGEYAVTVSGGDNRMMVVTNKDNLYGAGINGTTYNALAQGLTVGNVDTFTQMKKYDADNNGLTDLYFYNSDPNSVYVDNVVMAVTGDNHTMILRNDGSIYAWGNNASGQLGNYLTNANTASDSTNEGVTANGNPNDRVYPFRSGADDHRALFLNNALSIQEINGSTFKPEELEVTNAFGDKEKLLNWVLPAHGTGKADELGEEAFVVLHDNQTLTLDPKTITMEYASGFLLWNELSTTDMYALAVKSEDNVDENNIAQPWESQATTGRTLREVGLSADDLDADKLELTSSNHNVATVEKKGDVWTINPVKNGYGTANILVKYTGKDTPIYGVIRLSVIQDTAEVRKSTPEATAKLAAPKTGAGINFTVALQSDGTVWTWGVNNAGQLGDGSSTNRSEPVQVVIDVYGTPLKNITAIAVGDAFTVALDKDGFVWTWGLNANGQLGSRSSIGSRTYAQKVVIGDQPRVTEDDLYLHDIRTIAAGDDFAGAVDKNGYVYVWGSNDDGQTGRNGTSTSVNYPVRVLAGVSAPGTSQSGMTAANTAITKHLRDVVELAAGQDHFIALLDDGSVYAWGRNEYGQLGTEYTT
ncbi:MAG: hypothetical protein K2F83_01370, partial [Oscillospiraceae bacterium]|nr:hypothetical protein [Oscillospiraceae bacterium]